MYGTEQGHNKHNLIEGVAVEWGTKDTQHSIILQAEWLHAMPLSHYILFTLITNICYMS